MPSPFRRGESITRLVLEALPAVVALWVILVPFLDAPLFFDSKVLYACSSSVANEAWSMFPFLCANHPSPFWTGLFWMADTLSGGSIMVMHALMFSVATVSILALSSILRLMLPGRQNLCIRVGGLLLFSLHPVIIGNLTGFSLDLGILLIFPIFLSFLLHRKWTMTTIAATCLVFTKETGLALLIATLVVSSITATDRLRCSWTSFCSSLRGNWHLLIPIAAFILYAGFVILRYKVVPVHLEPGMSIVASLHRRMILLADVTMFQFQWISTIITGIGAVILVRAMLHHALPKGFPLRHAIFLGLLYVIGIVILTLTMPFNNVRYVMPVIPLGIILCAVSLSLISRRRWVHAIVIGGMVVLQWSALSRSNDPLSRIVYGTFRFGDQTLYSMAPAAEDGCCGQGRDQLVYNLQHQALRLVLEKAFATIKPGTADTLVADQTMFSNASDKLWTSFPRGIDPVSFRFSEKVSALHPNFTNPESLLQGTVLPQSAYFFEFPNIDNEAAKKIILKKYDVTETYHIRLGRYAMTVLRLGLR